MVNTLFLVDTGSPITFLRPDTLAALGFRKGIPVGAPVRVIIHGMYLYVSVSHGHFANVDLIGQDFFVAAKAHLVIDYKKLDASLHTAMDP